MLRRRPNRTDDDGHFEIYIYSSIYKLLARSPTTKVEIRFNLNCSADECRPRRSLFSRKSNLIRVPNIIGRPYKRPEKEENRENGTDGGGGVGVKIRFLHAGIVSRAVCRSKIVAAPSWDDRAVVGRADRRAALTVIFSFLFFPPKIRNNVGTTRNRSEVVRESTRWPIVAPYLSPPTPPPPPRSTKAETHRNKLFARNILPFNTHANETEIMIDK